MLSKKFCGRKSLPQPKVVEGIYCDFYNTLIDASGVVDTELVDYLNINYLTGEKIVIFSTEPTQAAERVTKIGLHPDIARVELKLNYYHRMLKTVIDDCPTVSLLAQTMFDPKSLVFRSIVRDVLRNAPPKAPAP